MKCWKGFWIRSTVRLQLCRRGSVVEDMGNKLTGRGEQGENESRGSRRKACRTCTLEDGISFHEGWGFVRAAINEPVWGVWV